MKSEFLLQNQSINYVPDEDSYFSSSSTSNSTVVLFITDLRVSGPASASDLFTFPFFDRSRAAVAVTGGAMNLIPSEWRQTQRGLSRLPHHYRLQTYRNSGTLRTPSITKCTSSAPASRLIMRRHTKARATETAL